MKRLSFFVVALTVLICLCPSGMAQELASPAGVNVGYWSDNEFIDNVFLDSEKLDNLTDIEAESGQELRIYLPPGTFLNNFGEILSDEIVTSRQLEASQIGVKGVVQSGGQALDEVVFRDSNEGVYISLLFVQDLAQTKTFEFEYQIYLTVDGEKVDGTEIPVSGVIGNRVVRVYSGQEYVDLSGGAIAEASSYITDITVDIGNGVTISANFFENSKYYGVASLKDEEDHPVLLERYPEIVMVYSLHTIGLRQDNRDTVTFQLSELYFAYGADGSFLGTTEKVLPYSSVYYLLNTRLDHLNVN